MGASAYEQELAASKGVRIITNARAGAGHRQRRGARGGVRLYRGPNGLTEPRDLPPGGRPGVQGDRPEARRRAAGVTIEGGKIAVDGAGRTSLDRRLGGGRLRGRRRRPDRDGGGAGARRGGGHSRRAGGLRAVAQTRTGLRSAANGTPRALRRACSATPGVPRCLVRRSGPASLRPPIAPAPKAVAATRPPQPRGPRPLHCKRQD